MEGKQKQILCGNSANIVKANHKRIRSYQFERIKRLKRDLLKQRKLNCISIAISSSNIQKKFAC